MEPTTDSVKISFTEKELKGKISLEKINTIKQPYPSFDDSEILRKFSWNNDDTSEEINLEIPRTRWFRFWAGFNRLPYSLRYILISGLGSLLIMVPGLISFFYFVNDTSVYFTKMQATSNNYFTIGTLPFFIWSIYFCILWCSWWGFRWASRSLPDIITRISEIFIGNTSEITGSGSLDAASKISKYLSYFRYLNRNVNFLVWCIVASVSWTTLFAYRPEGDSGNWYETGINIWATFIVFASLLLIEKFLLQLFTVQFHRRVYQERILINKNGYRVLNALNKRKPRNPSNPENAMPNDPPNTPENLSPSDAKSGNLKIFGDKAKNVSINVMAGVAQVIGAAVGIEMGTSQGIILRTPKDAKVLAKRLFDSLTQGVDTNIYPGDFGPFFHTEEDSLLAFNLFDKDRNGDISKNEMKIAVMDIFRERMSLERSLHASSQAIEKLDIILLVVFGIIDLFITLSIWSVNTTSFLTAAISVWAGLLFALGGVIKNLVESCIFLFFVHPYDVGDRIDVDGVGYIVKEFGLNVTLLKNLDGRDIYAPNSILSQKFIHNVRRSGTMSEKVSLHVSSNTSNDQIRHLRNDLFYFISCNSRDYVPKFEINIDSILDQSTMILSMGLEHKSNWHDGLKKSQRKNKFMFALKEAIQKYKIELPGGAMHVVMDQPKEPIHASQSHLAPNYEHDYHSERDDDFETMSNY